MRKSQPQPQVSVVVPTYNERQNIPELFDRLRRALDGRYTFQIIVVDDNSPDGTAEAVRRAADGNPEIRLVARPAKMGLASALAEGFMMAESEYLVVMDGDLSHRPEDLPGLLEQLAECDIAVGSRYVADGRILGWPIHRRMMSRLAGAAVRWWRFSTSAWPFAVSRRNWGALPVMGLPTPIHGSTALTTNGLSSPLLPKPGVRCRCGTGRPRLGPSG